MPQLTAPELSKVFNGKSRAFANTGGSKTGPLHFVLLAVLVLLLGAGAFKLFSQKQEPERIQVVAAGQDIPAGCKIDFASLHYLNIPKRYASASMFNSFEQLLGKTTNAYIGKGNPICTKDLLSSTSLSRSLSKNERAITLKLDPEFQVDHCLQNGDKVDVIVTVLAHGPGKSGSSKKYTKTVCQNLTVLVCTPREASLSKNTRGIDDNRITLAASPGDCEQLSQASETGKLRLVLRNYMYQSPNMLSGADEKDLIPAYALKAMELEALKDTKVAPAAAPFGMMTALPPPPPPVEARQMDPISVIQEKVAEPLQWVVEMFSGSKRESCVIPARQ